MAEKKKPPADLDPADPEKMAQETSPVFDEVNQQQSAKAYDRTDVASALKRDTDDGPGDDIENLPESDWQSYATEGVEVDDQEGR